MEYCEVVHVLHITLLEVRRDTELLSKEMEGVESLCLSLSDGRNVGAARECAKAYKVSPSVLQCDSLRRVLRCWLVE